MPKIETLLVSGIGRGDAKVIASLPKPWSALPTLSTEMLAFTLGTACALVVPRAPAPHVTPAFAAPSFAPRVAAHPVLQALPAAYSPAKEIAARGGKYYEGRTPEMSEAIKQALREVGRRKICVITGASSGLGLACVQALLRDYEVKSYRVGFQSLVSQDLRGCVEQSCSMESSPTH